MSPPGPAEKNPAEAGSDGGFKDLETLFARSMAEIGSSVQSLWPESPRLAVACSGGADSLALTLLAAGWAAQRGGRVLALTVDHGLREGSGAEALAVGRWLAALGIAHEILSWQGEKPRANLAARARAARYRLLAARCAELGIGDLLLGHHLEDQAETFLLRLARGSGVDGLSAMSPAAMVPVTLASVTFPARPPAPALRLLRPLLSVPRARLRNFLAEAGQDFIEDPSNRSPRFARNRLRSLMPALAGEGLTAERLAATATRLARARAALEQMSAAHLAAKVRFDPAGFAVLDPAFAAAAVPDEIALRALSLALRSVGGRHLPYRLERLERLLEALRQGTIGRGRTLGGCRLLPWRGAILLCREEAAAVPSQALEAGSGSALWDGRFLLSWRGIEKQGACFVAPLGRAGGRASLAADAAMAGVLQRLQALPGPARATLPALCGLDGVLAVPHLQYRRPGTSEGGDAWDFTARFLCPLEAAGGSGA